MPKKKQGRAHGKAHGNGHGKAAFLTGMRRPDMTSIAQRITDKYGPAICDSCLGRQFGNVSTGMTNSERGTIVKELLSQSPPNRSTTKSTKKNSKKKCAVCNGLFQKGLEKWSARALRMLKGIEYDSFVVGSRLSKDLISKEEGIWGLCGIAHCEPLKTELNRELGKIIWKKTRKTVDELTPDILVLFDLEARKVILNINPLFLYGEYTKLVRGIPQTKWDMYKVSVEDIMAKPVMKATKGKAHAMHGAGREDIDGNGAVNTTSSS